jgi:uncharacterized membrane protein
MGSKARIVVFVGLIAAAYVVLTLALAPISYGPVQFRVSELLKPLVLFNPYFAISFGIGTGMANLFSPFGAWDYIAMAIVDVVAAYMCWLLRKWVWFALVVQAIIISAGVAIFPLGFGGGFPPIETFIFVLIPELILLLVGYGIIWRKYGAYLLRRWE